MSYRGDDLDLRTPRGLTATGEGAGAAGGEGSSNSIERYAPARRPIWVDETVLACCNHAFDLAVAHRAPEVRLEHLLHAMTRVEGAAETLEARGVRVFNLRRETAAAIAHDLPVIPKDAPVNPRRSDELEEILRRAAAQAFRYGSSPNGDPAGVEDIVDVLSDVRLDIAALGAFGRRAAPGGREAAPFRRGFSSGAPGPADSFRRDRARPASMMYDGPQEGAGEPPRRDVVEHVETAKGGEAPVPLIADRLQALEQILRDLKDGAASQTGLMEGAAAQIERAARMAAAEASSGLGGVTETLKALGARLELASGLPAAALAPLDDRLAIIEEAILNPASGGGAELGGRFDALRRDVETQWDKASAAYAAIGAEIKTFSTALARLDGVKSALDAHHAGLGAAVDGKMSEIGGKLGEKLAALFADAGKRNEDRVSATMLAALEDQTAVLKDQTSAVAVKLGEGWNALLADAGARQDQRAHAMEAAIMGALRLVETRQKTVTNAVEQFGKAMGECLDHIEGRLERLESGQTKALALVEAIHRLTFERHYWRSRFWRWLLGTNDWMAASWPAAMARLDAEIDREAAR